VHHALDFSLLHDSLPVALWRKVAFILPLAGGFLFHHTGFIPPNFNESEEGAVCWFCAGWAACWQFCDVFEVGLLMWLPKL
jgi:hypothetical protein